MSAKHCSADTGKELFFCIPKRLTSSFTATSSPPCIPASDGIFIIVDGFSSAKASGRRPCSINILWPIAAVILATGLGIGSGGSVVMTHAMGAGDTEKALAARGNTLLCLGAATVLLTAALGLSYPWLLRLLGATGELYQPRRITPLSSCWRAACRYSTAD
mgnify:CR=1 FL=1